MTHKQRKTKRKARRVTSLKPVPPKSARQKAADAMQPYLDEFQQAADEQTRSDFGNVPAKKPIVP